ncbi:hypothetical protein LTR96_003656 [Exophiala xenobiotica]|nr:hypothetical protein LTR96_003656 [Exophiala xenobiotica]KAK5343063.1 hypothetical protein LTR98_000692 [Exophiala xenobiotica]
MYGTIFVSDDGSQSEEEDPLPLPTLTENPLHHPDCCLGLSASLLGTILDILQPHIASESSPTGTQRKTKCLSIGSGTGLFEALLRNYAPGLLEVHGLEVSSSTNANKYLPKHMRHTVPSTSTFYEEASEYDVWLFVYPRDPRLVRRYREVASENEDPTMILFLGPKADFLPPYGDNDEAAAAENEEKPVQETFAAVLGSFSDHIEVCQEFSRHEYGLLNVPASQEPRLGQEQSVHDSSNKTSHNKPFRSSIYSSADIGLTSYEILCVLRQCDG